jgi:arylsulfatase A-like enzyme
MDLSKESPETLALYGCTPGEASFARACLLARRLVERGVRFVTIYHEGWDGHSDVAGNVRGNCEKTDRASAGLVTDLRRRGMLDSTLVVWGGEFGRTPMVEASAVLGRSKGRDHHPNAFTMWLAGGGIRPGVTHGSTDELGFHVASGEVHVHDLQATILHCLGLDHERLTFRSAGRDFRLTDVHGRVVNAILS